MQLIGTDLHLGVAAFTPWMDRPALNAFFSIQYIAKVFIETDLEFQVYHKDRDETGQGTAATSTLTIAGTSTLPAIGSINATGLKELIRFRVQVVGLSDKRCWIRFQILNPSPYETATSP